MNDIERPDLGLYVYEQIEAKLHQVDENYWRELRGMQVFLLLEPSFHDFLNPSPPR
jgi:hypothetical protein